MELERIFLGEEGDGCMREELRVVGLVKTHEKYQRIDWVGKICQMRELKDKKGGGLLMLYEVGGGILVEKIDCPYSDILVTVVEIDKVKMMIVMVYLDTREQDRNERIYEELDKVMENKRDDLDCLTMGDFNGHVGFLGDYETNVNGVRLLNFGEKRGLVILNADDKCEGVYTRVQGETRSVLNYYLVNEGMYRRFERLQIDEGERNIRFI